MEALMKFAVDYMMIDVAIGAMGLFALALILERVKSLYFDYSMDTVGYMGKIMKFVEEDKIDEAITYSTANQKKPLAHVVKRVLERSDRDDKAMEMSLDIAASEIAPTLSRNLNYLSMASNVVTLIGLLGTVVGLIMSFKAVAFADPAQKQTLLADGISMAMHSTAMGLLVAIPVMVVYSFLHARQSKLFNEIDQNASRLMELLKSRDFTHFNASGVYPSGLGLEPAKVKNGGSNLKSV